MLLQTASFQGPCKATSREVNTSLITSVLSALPAPLLAPFNFHTPEPGDTMGLQLERTEVSTLRDYTAKLEIMMRKDLHPESECAYPVLL